MKKIIWFISCFFLMINSSWAITLNCPEVASPGEIISCQVEEDKYIGITSKYQFDEGLVYQESQVTSGWNDYYNGILGFSVGNVISTDKLSLTLKIKVDMDILVNRDYSIGLVHIEGCTSDYQYVLLEDVERKVKIISDINTLDSLMINQDTLVPNFDKNVTRYQLELDSDKVFISGVATDSEATIEGDIGEQTLHYGVNKFVIKVTSVRGNEKEYVLYISRPILVSDPDSTISSNNSSLEIEKNSTKSNDVTLKSLSLSNGEINFKSDTFLYFITVDYRVEYIDVIAIANHDSAKVEIQSPDLLDFGENTIYIKVIAEDGSIGTYMIVVTREEQKSSDASIKDIVIRGYDLEFKSDLYQYDLEIDYEDQLEIVVELNYPKATYKIVGNKNLKNNSIIQIIVTAEDGTQRTYQIHIIKLNESNSSSIMDSNYFLSLIGVIVLIMFVLILKKIKNKLEKKKENN